jgi:large subunit ribosomal protein L25
MCVPQTGQVEFAIAESVDTNRRSLRPSATLLATIADRMTSERIQLELHQRAPAGSRAARRMRSEGLIPGVIYGQGSDPQPFYVVERELRRATAGGERLNAIFQLAFKNGPSDLHAVVKDYQLHPTRAKLLHIDLQEIKLDQAIQSSVAIETTGQAPGVLEGGILNIVQRELNVEGLPLKIPDLVGISIEGMQLGESRTVADIEVPEGVTVLDDPDSIVLTVAVTRVTLVEAVVEGVEGLEGDEDEDEDGDGDDAGETGSEGDADS